jgi:alpha-beta hydrolase superfamily lysophospholipase
MSGSWVPDVLGHPFEQLTLDLGDGDGALVATLVRSIPNRIASLGRPFHDVDVLYVHGWSDYFFQTGLARFWTDRGARFHALDLRRYGRSLRDGDTPGYTDDLSHYDVDISAALDAMGQPGGDRRLVLLGHSTGGLILTLWAARHPGEAAALVLNSPWLELQLGATGRQALAPLIGLGARVAPRGAQPVVDFGFYTRAQREIGSLPSEELPLAWRPERGFATHPGWLNAVMNGHRAVAAGVDAGCPVLVLLSTASTSPVSWSPRMTSTDSVLVVDEIARAATRIGRRVAIERVEGAIHDVFLSSPEPRAAAYAALDGWLRHGALRG